MIDLIYKNTAFISRKIYLFVNQMEITNGETELEQKYNNGNNTYSINVPNKAN